MKILLATDGSKSAEHAEDLVAAIAWPHDTTVEIVCVDQLADDELDLSDERFAASRAARQRAIDDRLTALTARVSQSRRTVRGRVVLGRPATVIVSEAEQLGADLVIVGSREHGALASLALGSVAAEVVDHAPCPVLVARRSTLGPIVLGADGSASARGAEDRLAGWPFLAPETINVVSVSTLLPPWYAGLDAGMSLGVDAELMQEVIDERAKSTRRIAEEAADRLHRAGLQAKAGAAEGIAADGLLAAIATTKAQLVVVGSRGNTGLARLFLGSVARNVLYRAPCSILIVREKKPVAGPKPERALVGAA
jgi:nucleotide-binding universal stress UspA family protein